MKKLDMNSVSEGAHSDSDSDSDADGERAPLSDLDAQLRLTRIADNLSAALRRESPKANAAEVP